jgi:hypothetical protein
MKDEELPPQLAKLIAEARRAHDPSEDDLTRVHQGLVVSLAIPPLAGSAGATHASAQAARSSAATGGAAKGAGFAGAGGLTLKLLTAGVIVGAGLTWAGLERRPATRPTPAQIAAPTPAAAPNAAVSTPPASTDGTGSPLTGELALMRATLAALRDGAPALALVRLEEHARLYPHGALAHERRALRGVALCEAGQRAEGLRERAAFLRTDAASPLALRVRGACGEHP